MSKQTQVLEALRASIDALRCYAGVTYGALPPGGGLSMAVAGGRALTVTLGNDKTLALDVTLNASHANQNVAMDTLSRIHEAMNSLTPLPQGEGWQVIALRTANAPACADRQGERWLYTSMLTVEYAIE